MTTPLFLLLCFLLSSPSLFVDAYPPPSDSCNRTCGGIEIPFPFGIGNKKCYLTEWYEVTCNTTGGSPTARLPKINRELESIVLERGSYSVVYIKSPVSSSGCSQYPQEKNLSLNLTGPGSPFFVTDSNRLVSVGCAAKAEITEIESQIIGCKSTCDQNKLHLDKTCGGYKCCQAKIPAEKPQVIGIDLEDPVSNTTQCVVAFMTNETYSPANVTDPEKFYAKGFTSIELGWYFDTSASNNTQECFSNSYTLTGTPSCVCYMYGFRYSTCYCSGGFRGNPYLPNGCSDINECDEKENPCPGSHCVNTLGSFHCKPKISEKIKNWILRGLAIGVPLMLVVFGMLGSWIFFKKRRKVANRKKLFERNGGLFLKQHLDTVEGGKSKIFTFKEIVKATDNFNEDRILGEGGQGKVFKGMLSNGNIVAVKRSKSMDERKVEQFVNEVKVLSNINHRHVVKLLGCCLELEVPVLVFEYIQNGDLYKKIHTEDLIMTWDIRLRIAKESAGALDYLHAYAENPILHRDIKTSNILLDEKYRAKISDFGISREIEANRTHQTTVVAGTFGYLDPEISITNQFRYSSDVYSFGVVLAEMITGKKAIFNTQSGDRIGLVEHFKTAMKEGNLYEIVDFHIREECKMDQVVAVAKLARRCLRPRGKNRPKMREVSMELEMISSSTSPLQTLEEQIEEEEEEEEALGLHDIEDSWSINMTAPASLLNPSPNLDAEPVINLPTM